MSGRRAERRDLGIETSQPSSDSALFSPFYAVIRISAKVHENLAAQLRGYNDRMGSGTQLAKLRGLDNGSSLKWEKRSLRTAKMGDIPHFSGAPSIRPASA
jgi:hypothetical protein